MREDHALGVAGAAGGVLQQRDVGGAQRRGRRRRGTREFAGGGDEAELGRLQPQQARQRARLGHGDERRGARVHQDAPVAAQVILDLGRARRRINRYRDGAGGEHAEEAREVFAAGRQHDGHRLARLHAARLQPGADRLGRARERRVVERFLGVGVREQGEVRTLRVRAHMPGEHVPERQRGFRRRFGRPQCRRPRRCRNMLRRRGCRRQQAPQVVYRLRRQYLLFGQAPAARSLQAREQLDARGLSRPASRSSVLSSVRCGGARCGCSSAARVCTVSSTASGVGATPVSGRSMGMFGVTRETLFVEPQVLGGAVPPAEVLAHARVYEPSPFFGIAVKCHPRVPRLPPSPPAGRRRRQCRWRSPMPGARGRHWRQYLPARRPGATIGTVP